MLTRIGRKLHELAKGSAKAAYQRFRFRSEGAKTVGLIMGMQRSGTGMLNEAFGNDWSCQVFGEDGGLALGAAAGHRMRWRWKSYSEVADILKRQRAPLLIAKPLVESQWAEQILETIPEARIIWAYRHYQDVALSAQQLFGSEAIMVGLTAILEGRRDWYSENIEDATRATVKEYYSDSSPYDLWALGWYVRNSLILRYNQLPLTFVGYDTLVRQPVQEMRRLYRFLDFKYPGDHIVGHIRATSVRRGRSIEISSDICELCDSMLAELESRRLLTSAG